MLLVWLPMDGKIENKGLLVPYTPSSINAVSAVTEGVFGSSYKFYDSGLTYIRFNTSVAIRETMNNHSFSVCAWIKTDKNRCWLSITYAFRFWVKNQYIPGNSVTDTTNRAMDGKWHHVCTTHDNSTLKTCYYIDGILSVSGQSSTPASTTYTNATDIGHDVNNGSNPGSFFDGNICDVRIYNHALSQKEVSELSKGLVVHYKLDDEYTEKTTNLGGTSVNYSNQTYGNAYNASSWGGDKGTVTFYPNGGYNNYPYKVYHKTSGGTGGIYRKTANDITIESGKTYTMSIYVKSDRNYTDSTYSFNINGSSVTNSNHYITPPTSVKFTTEWQRVVHTFTATSAQTGKYGEMSIIYNDAVEDYYVYFSGFQIELNDHPTPYTIGTSIPICCDCSGYGNDGTVYGTLKTYSGSPRYNNAIYFGASTSSYIRVPDMKYNSDNYTFSWWAKTNTLTNKMAWGFIDGNRLNIYPTSNVFCLNTGDGASNPFKNNGTSVAFSPF